MPVWLVHGDADPIIDVGESRRLYAAFKSAGADVHLTELPGVGHSAWDAAYRNVEIATWLFAQRRSQDISRIGKPSGAGGTRVNGARAVNEPARGSRHRP